MADPTIQRCRGCDASTVLDELKVKVKDAWYCAFCLNDPEIIVRAQHMYRVNSSGQECRCAKCEKGVIAEQVAFVYQRCWFCGDCAGPEFVAAALRLHNSCTLMDSHVIHCPIISDT